MASEIKGGEADVANGKFFGCCIPRSCKLITRRGSVFSTNLGAKLVEGERLGHSELLSATVKSLSSRRYRKVGADVDGTRASFTNLEHM